MTLFTPEQVLNIEYIKACIRAAAFARLFVATTDDAPLTGFTYEQGDLWDSLTEAISVIEEMEA